ncbi:MAG TPA: outer membrane protein assembly factor BamA [Dissulfurispiraceae bacterium]|nr:outer membrane protein assembly factor BamA [Dissulfurispiraceae bacterium]
MMFSRVLLVSLAVMLSMARTEIVFAAVETLKEIESIEVVGATRIKADELLQLLNLSRGTVLQPVSLRAGIKRAYLKGMFDDIRIERLSDNPLRLRIVVQERPRISGISFQGNDHFSRSDLKEWFGMNAGEFYQAGKGRRALGKLVQEMRRRGYRRADASLNTVKTAGDIKIAVTITEGAPVVIRHIRLEDDSGYLASKLNVSEGDVLDEALMDRDAEKIKQKLAQKGFVRTKISWTFDNNDTLTVRLNRGLPLELSFIGNSALGDGELTRQTTFFELNDASADLIEESLVRMRSRYREEGYPDVQIIPVTTESAEAVKIAFYISEGTQQRVRSIAFSRNRIPAEKLRDQISFRPKDPFNDELVEANRESLERYYRNAGYLDVQVASPEIKTENGFVDMVFQIEEGPLTHVSSIALDGVSTERATELLGILPFKQGDTYSDATLALAKIRIAEWYQRRGYNDARIDTSRVLSESKAAVRISILEGPVSRFGKTIIAGNEKTRETVIRRELLHEEGDLFDPKKLLDERVALSRTGLFSSIDIQPESSEDGNRDVVYRIQESPAGAIEFGAGYSEYEQFRAFFDMSYRNLFGLNHQVQFRTDFSSLLKRATFSYYYPWVFGQRDLAFKALVLAESKKEISLDNHQTLYRSNRIGFNAGLEKQFSHALKVEIGYDLSNVRTFDVKPDIILSREDTGTLLISALHIGLLYDGRDNVLDPRNGYSFGATFKLASPALFSETSFSKATAFLNIYKSLSRRFVAAVSVRGGIAQGFGSTNDLPLIERFFLGGRTTVRGYVQDTLGPKGSDGSPRGGNAYLMGNFEMRSNVWQELGLVTFLDWGNVWSRMSDISLSNVKYTTGLGVRYSTPVGPLRVDYGIKLNRDAGESRGAFHFSIGQAF